MGIHIDNINIADKELLQHFNNISYALITIVYDDSDKTGNGAITYTDFIGKEDSLSIDYQEADIAFEKICDEQMFDS